MKQNDEGVITEVHNCAEFLVAANAMIGKKKGPACFDNLDIRKDVVSATPGNIDNRCLRSTSARVFKTCPLVGRASSSALGTLF